MLIGGIVAVVVVVGMVAGAALRRRSQDDVHSVEHYHRQLHTLEEMRTHPFVAREDGNGEASYPASAFRVSSSSTVRLTEPDGTIVPPAPPPSPPPLPNPGEPVTFDDAPGAEADGRAESVPWTFITGIDDPAMHSINQRPRRLGGPLAAIAAVVILVVILVAAGLHSNTPSHRGGDSTATTVTHSHAGTHAGSHARHTTHTTTTTTAPPAPIVSAPANASPYAATYQVADASYSLELAAKTGECWVSATDTSTGKVLFTGTLSSGQTQTVAATGPMTVIAGAPSAFSATVNGAPVTLPTGALAPFTLTFKTPGGTSGGTTGSSGNTGTTSG